MSQNVLIIGATGVIGSYITAAIVNEKSKFGRIRILTSEKTVGEKVEEIAALKSNGVEIQTGSLDSEADVKSAYEGTLPSRRL
jgi:aspartate-semialdehyde dehydrogenase